MHRRARTNSAGKKASSVVSFAPVPAKKTPLTQTQIVEEQVKRLIQKAPARPLPPTVTNIAESSSEDDSTADEWFPGNPSWVRVYFQKKDKRIVQEGVNSVILNSAVADTPLLSCDVNKADVSSPEAWARVLDAAALVTPDRHTLSWSDVDSSGLLTLYVDREPTSTEDGRVVWTDPEVWAKDSRPLQTMAAEMRKLAPEFK
jgi:hypothetical protein